MKISIIAAMDNNRVIGKQGKLVWHLSADLQFFKKTTMGKPIIMGRKTFEGIGRPLPGRRNIIITRQKAYQAEGCDVVHSLEEALNIVGDVEEVMIIGGADIFKQALGLADQLFFTFIDHEFEGDAYFPDWDHDQWKIISEQPHNPDSKNPYPYRFVHLVRKN